MKRKELDALKAKLMVQADKACDLDILVSQMMTLPYGQLKKVLTEEVMAVLAKYGYGVEA